jgi:hypothetical protein
MMNAQKLAEVLYQGVAVPIVQFLSKGFGYQPVEGEYNYALVWETQTLAGNANSGEIPVTVSQDAGFLWEALVGVSTGTYTLTIRDTGKEIRFMNAALQNTMLVGTAQRPGYMSLKPYWFRPNSTITIDFTDISGSSNEIRIAMLGRRAKTDPGAFAYTRGAMSRMA